MLLSGCVRLELNIDVYLHSEEQFRCEDFKSLFKTYIFGHQSEVTLSISILRRGI